MTDHATKQAQYEARRRAATKAQIEPLRTFRIVEASGNERAERFPDMVKAAAAYPGAIFVADVEKYGGFW